MQKSTDNEVKGTASVILKGPFEEVQCKQACPAGIDVPRYIRLAREGRFVEALSVIRERNPFPSVTGHVCLCFCESKCRRDEVDEPTAINALERFVTEQALGTRTKESVAAKASGKRVAIIGSGPAGLTAAYYLAKLGGHSVTVFEAFPEPGGMMRFGIPDYRLPKNVLAADIDAIKSVGVNIKTNSRVESLDELLEQGFDAVLLAVGAHQGQKPPIPGADLDGVLVGTSFLKDMSLSKEVNIRKRVVVLGGGDVAFDCARTALRLGVSEAHIACLEPREAMVASRDEIEQGVEEGVIIHPSQTFIRIVSDDGHISGVECLDVRSFEFDDEGGVHIESVAGSEHILPADTVILAIGQVPQLGFIEGDNSIKTTQRGTLEADPITLATGREGIFAGGDAVTGTASVIEAVAAGRKASVAIDRYLGGNGVIDEALAPPEQKVTWLGFDESILDVGRLPMPLLPVAKRANNFAEVKLGFTKELALKEAERCLMCDQRLSVKIALDKCRECYACQLICSLIYQGACNPEEARIWVGLPNEISYNKDCIGGCSLCIQHCLVDAISISA